MSDLPSALEILVSVETKGYSLTLERLPTSKKWITGKNLFMGICAPDGLTVRDAYGVFLVEMPLHVGDGLDWVDETGAHVSDYSQALKNTIKRGKVRRSSIIYNTMLFVSQFAK